MQCTQTHRVKLMVLPGTNLQSLQHWGTCTVPARSRCVHARFKPVLDFVLVYLPPATCSGTTVKFWVQPGMGLLMKQVPADAAHEMKCTCMLSCNQLVRIAANLLVQHSGLPKQTVKRTTKTGCIAVWHFTSCFHCNLWLELVVTGLWLMWAMPPCPAMPVYLFNSGASLVN